MLLPIILVIINLISNHPSRVILIILIMIITIIMIAVITSDCDLRAQRYHKEDS